MNTKKQKLESYGGNGFDTCHLNGKYRIAFGDDNVQEFTDLYQAKKFYDGLNEEKFFWDVTGMPELIDAWVLSEVANNG